MATYLNGQSGSVSIASTVLPVESWTSNITCEALDVTTTGSAGWMQFIAGIKGGEVQVKTFWDSSAVPTGTVGVTPGASVSLTLTIGSSGKTITGTALVTSIDHENAAKGVVNFNFSAKFTGTITLPS